MAIMSLLIVLAFLLATVLRSSFGQSTVESTGRSIRVSADGKPEMKHIGVTIDWSTVAAVTGSDVTTLDGLLIKVGEKYLRYGQVIVIITASSKYGPYDPAAADGRQLGPFRDTTFVLNKTMKEDEVASDHPQAMSGGLAFKSRIIQSGVAAHTLALGPTLAELQAALPRLQLVTE